MSRPRIPIRLRRLVIQRAKQRCEYCLLHQNDAPEPHGCDHITALKHRGRTSSENLALACARCNNHKGSDLASADPLTGEIVLLFNPRTDNWRDHFTFAKAHIIGLTATGRATVELLRFNDPLRLEQRQVLTADGQYPPAEYL